MNHKKILGHDNKLVNICILIVLGSSSGKTILELRLKRVSLEVDNYYRHNDIPEYPLDELGNPNFETIDALRLDYFNKSLLKLLNGETINVPKFDFINGRYIDNGCGSLKLDCNGVLIIEGIFCLNPLLTKMIDDKQKFKIFICPLIIGFLNLDNCHFLSEQVVRMVRRISRDHQYRGCFNWII